MSQIRTVLAGIDTFYYGVYIDEDIYDQFLSEYRDLFDTTKDAARKNKNNAKIEIGRDHKKRRFFIQPNGRENYRWIIYNSDVAICLSTISKKAYPCVRIELRSQYLWRKGYKTAINNSLNWIRSVIGEVMKTVVSRVDFCKDVTGWNLNNARLDHFVGKPRTQSKDYHLVDHLDFFSRRCHSIRFGKGNNIVVRIYNKIKEIRDTGNKKEWFYKMWHEYGWLEGVPVWRIEVQFGREALRRQKIYSINHCLNKLQDLWRIGTRWIELRVPENKKKVTDWLVHDDWKSIQRVPKIFKPNELQEITCEMSNKFGDFHLLNTGIGSLTSYMATLDQLSDAEKDDEFLYQLEVQIDEYCTKVLYEYGFGGEIELWDWKKKLIRIAKHKKAKLSTMDSPVQQPDIIARNRVLEDNL